MNITNVTSQSRYDFCADMECEHCGATAHLTTGYDDNNYHKNVIPSMRCKSCGKNRAGELPPAPAAKPASAIIEQVIALMQYVEARVDAERNRDRPYVEARVDAERNRDRPYAGPRTKTALDERHAGLCEAFGLAPSQLPQPYADKL